MTTIQDAGTGPLTFTFDIGGSHLKAGILSPAGILLRGPAIVATPHPTKPDNVVVAAT